MLNNKNFRLLRYIVPPLWNYSAAEMVRFTVTSVFDIAVIVKQPHSDNTPYEKIDDEVRSLADLAPFEIPSSWEWCRVGDLFSNMAGLAYKKDALALKADKMVRVLRGGNIGEEQFYFKGDDVFISSELVKPELYLRKNYMITPAVSSLDHIGKIALIDKDYSATVVVGLCLCSYRTLTTMSYRNICSMLLLLNTIVITAETLRTNPAKRFITSLVSR